MRLAELAALALLPLAFSISCGKKDDDKPKEEIKDTAPTSNNESNPQDPVNPPEVPPVCPPIPQPPLVQEPPIAFMHPIEGVWQHEKCSSTFDGFRAYITTINKKVMIRTWARFSDKECTKFLDEYNRYNESRYFIDENELDFTVIHASLFNFGSYYDQGKSYYTVFEIKDNFLYFGEKESHSPEERSYKIDYTKKWRKLNVHPRFNVQ